MTLRGLRARAGAMGAGHALYVPSQWGMLTALAQVVGPDAVGRFARGPQTCPQLNPDPRFRYPN